MGNGMDKILPGLYIGNIRDAKDEKKLNDNGITHILSIHDNAKPLIKSKRYLCIQAHDNAEQDLLQFFPQCNDFIHDGRVSGGGVLVHCLAGVSRSVTVTVAYLMTVTGLEWRDALNAVRGARHCANPNFGFQRQLVAFQHDHLHTERQRYKSEKGGCPTKQVDLTELLYLKRRHQHWVLNGKDPDDILAAEAFTDAVVSSASSIVINQQAGVVDDDEKTYPLPHNAYGKKFVSKGESSSMKEGGIITEEREEEDSTDMTLKATFIHCLCTQEDTQSVEQQEFTLEVGRNEEGVRGGVSVNEEGAVGGINDAESETEKTAGSTKASSFANMNNAGNLTKESESFIPECLTEGAQGPKELSARKKPSPSIDQRARPKSYRTDSYDFELIGKELDENQKQTDELTDEKLVDEAFLMEGRGNKKGQSSAGLSEVRHVTE